MSSSVLARPALRRSAPALVAVLLMVGIALLSGGFRAEAVSFRAAPVELGPRCTITGTTPAQVQHPSGVWLYKLTGGSRLDPGQYCQIGRGGIIMQTNGELVVYNEFNEKVWWAATRGRGHHAVVQADGNIVVYRANNTAVWSSYTAGLTGGFLAVQNDGNVVLYNASWTVYWATDTEHGSSGGLPPVSSATPTPSATATAVPPGTPNIPTLPPDED